MKRFLPCIVYFAHTNHAISEPIVSSCNYISRIVNIHKSLESAIRVLVKRPVFPYFLDAFRYMHIAAAKQANRSDLTGKMHRVLT